MPSICDNTVYRKRGHRQTYTQTYIHWYIDEIIVNATNAIIIDAYILNRIASSFDS